MYTKQEHLESIIKVENYFNKQINKQATKHPTLGRFMGWTFLKVYALCQALRNTGDKSWSIGLVDCSLPSNKMVEMIANDADGKYKNDDGLIDLKKVEDDGGFMIESHVTNEDGCHVTIVRNDKMTEIIDICPEAFYNEEHGINIQPFWFENEEDVKTRMFFHYSAIPVDVLNKDASNHLFERTKLMPVFSSEFKSFRKKLLYKAEKILRRV